MSFLIIAMLTLLPVDPVCEGSGTVPVCVTLQTDIERNVTAIVSAFNGVATGKHVHTYMYK